VVGEASVVAGKLISQAHQLFCTRLKNSIKVMTSNIRWTNWVWFCVTPVFHFILIQ